MDIEVITYGAHLRTVNVPDRNENTVDVTIGLDSIGDYEDRNDYFGCIAGRFCNRIDGGTFTLSQKEYRLGLNDGANTLHGGFCGFDKRLWTVKEEICDSEQVGVALNYLSPDGEEGYPSTCDVTVRYLLSLDSNILEIAYYAATDRETVVNLTSHAFWNLNGNVSEENAICNGSHELALHSSFITPIDERLIPNGDLFHVNDSPFDFKKLFDVGSRINDSSSSQLRFGRGYDHNWVINNDGYKQGDLMTDVAVLRSNDNGIRMAVDTDQPGIQFYSGNFLDSTKRAKDGQLIAYRGALALETQHFPDSPNKVNFPSTVLRRDRPFTSRTRFKFTTE